METYTRTSNATVDEYAVESTSLAQLGCFALDSYNFGSVAYQQTSSSQATTQQTDVALVTGTIQTSNSTVMVSLGCVAGYSQGSSTASDSSTAVESSLL